MDEEGKAFVRALDTYVDRLPAPEQRYGFMNVIRMYLADRCYELREGQCVGCAHHDTDHPALCAPPHDGAICVKRAGRME
jgi:hypothetical protein